MMFTDGTPCTGNFARSIEVKLDCRPESDTQGDRLGIVEEPATCRYTASLFLRAACELDVGVPDSELGDLEAAALARVDDEQAGADDSVGDEAAGVDEPDSTESSDAEADGHVATGILVSDGEPSEAVFVDGSGSVQADCDAHVNRVAALEQEIGRLAEHLKQAREAADQQRESLDQAMTSAEGMLQGTAADSPPSEQTGSQSWW